MIKYLLDTTPLAAYLFGRQKAVALLAPWIQNHEVATSILVYGEVNEYLMTLRSAGKLPDFAARQAQLRLQLKEIKPYSLTTQIMNRYVDLRLTMRAPYGTGLIGDVDTLIAATAIQYNLTIVTADAHFQRVPGLTYTMLASR